MIAFSKKKLLMLPQSQKKIKRRFPANLESWILCCRRHLFHATSHLHSHLFAFWQQTHAELEEPPPEKLGQVWTVQQQQQQRELLGYLHPVKLGNVFTLRFFLSKPQHHLPFCQLQNLWNWWWKQEGKIILQANAIHFPKSQTKIHNFPPFI